ncbi:MAG: recombinase family protein [Actinobacteria bacterium]|nr:recombinase family protein [Actinomycetota bacterium]
MYVFRFFVVPIKDILLFNVLAMVAEFESDLIRLRTVEGMKVAKAKGRLRPSSPS